MCAKCSWGDGLVIKPDGEHELDPCIYRDVELYHNVTIIVSKCVKCGNTIFTWMKQDDTEREELA